MLLIVQKVATFDNWAQICRINMYGCDVLGYNTGDDNYDAQCSSPHGKGASSCDYCSSNVLFIYYVVSLMLFCCVWSRVLFMHVCSAVLCVCVCV
jgi:hypothetical protein